MKTEQKSELNAKIEKLIKEDQLNSFVSSNFPGIKNTNYISDWKNKEENVINFNVKDLSEFKHILTTLPPTNKATTIGTASDSFYKTIKSPYRMTLKNPCVISQFTNFELSIKYTSSVYGVQICVPLSLIKGDFFNVSDRQITSSEYHYFVGLSQSQLAQKRVKKMYFSGVHTAGKDSGVISWYGGDQTLLNVKEINKIIKILIK